MMTSAICRVKVSSSQKPPPQASTRSSGAAPTNRPATNTVTVARRAKTKASGMKRSAKAVNARASRCTLFLRQVVGVAGRGEPQCRVHARCRMQAALVDEDIEAGLGREQKLGQ